jgi:muramoyltetrapeptide carboxypeptidase
VPPGARVGVAALSGPVDPQKLEAGLAGLERLGYQPVAATNLRHRHSLFAGTDDERLAAFHALVDDPSLAAIFFTRGGHGVLRLLPRFDWARIAVHPRAYVGYSDLTPFLHEISRRCGWVAFHGPLVAGELAAGLSAEEEESLRAALEGRLPVTLSLAGCTGDGAASGALFGGCLSLLVATLGTAFAPQLEGALLFWEETGEPLYRIDRMLTHLGLSGTLTGLRGMVAGHVGGHVPEAGAEPAWLDALRARGELIPSPVAWGLAAGHERPNLTLPLGLQASLDGARRELTVGLR